jgi:hypothetical protein
MQILECCQCVQPLQHVPWPPAPQHTSWAGLERAPARRRRLQPPWPGHARRRRTRACSAAVAPAPAPGRALGRCHTDAARSSHTARASRAAPRTPPAHSARRRGQFLWSCSTRPHCGGRSAACASLRGLQRHPFRRATPFAVSESSLFRSSRRIGQRPQQYKSEQTKRLTAPVQQTRALSGKACSASTSVAWPRGLVAPGLR